MRNTAHKIAGRHPAKIVPKPVSVPIKQNIYADKASTATPIIFSSTCARSFAQYFAAGTYNKFVELDYLGDTAYSNSALFIAGLYNPTFDIWRQIKFNKIIIMFSGYDIIQLKDVEQRQILQYFKSRNCVFAVEAPHLQAYIRDLLGIETEVIYIPTQFKFSVPIRPTPHDYFNVGCYFPGSISTSEHQEWYNYKLISEVARRMPDVIFHYYAISGRQPPSPVDSTNIIYYPDPIYNMIHFLEGMNCGIRITKHDTYSMSGIEYNLAGRWFINNHYMPHCDIISHNPSIDEVVAAINTIKVRTGVNNDGFDYYSKLHNMQAFANRISGLL